MAKKCARTFSIVVEKGKKSILDVGHLLPGGIARYVWSARVGRPGACAGTAYIWRRVTGAMHAESCRSSSRSVFFNERCSARGRLSPRNIFYSTKYG